MKKHLIALAVAGAVAAPAMAQNVTMYGVFDVSVQSKEGSTDSTLLKNGGVSSGVLGFKGSEDLGGGLKAEFQLQGDLDVINNGDLGDGTNATFADEAWVGLSGAFGAIRVGTSDTTSAQGIDSMAASIFGNLATISTANGAVNQIGGDVAGTVRYTSPKIGGAKFEVGHSNVESTAAATAVTSVYGEYAAGALTAKVGYSTTAVSDTTDKSETLIGVSYNLGVATVGLVRQNLNHDTAASESDNTMLGVTVPMGNGINLGLAYDRYDIHTGTDYTKVTVGANKALSKRTSVYAAYQSRNNSGTTVDNKVGTVGLIHSF